MKTRTAMVGAAALWLMAVTAACAVPCSEEADNADDLAELCKQVSPATRPPCNTSNACSLIESEIARGCKLLSAAERPTQCKED